MDNTALSLTRAISDFLEQNERRFSALQLSHDAQTKQLTEMQLRVDTLEAKCHTLTEEKDQLQIRVEQEHQIQERLSKQLDRSDVEVENARKQLDSLHSKLAKWEKLTSTIANLVSELTDSRDRVKEKLKKLEQDQVELSHQIKRYSERHRTEPSPIHAYQPNVVRSPSVSSYLHQHTPSSRVVRPQNNYHPQNIKAFAETSLDANDDLSVISDSADALRREVGLLNELHRSFERGSVYSDD